MTLTIAPEREPDVSMDIFIRRKKIMPKFKVDLDKDLLEQPFWNLLKPEVKLKAIKAWKNSDKKVDELIGTGEVVIDPTIPERNMFVTIPDNQLTEGEK